MSQRRSHYQDIHSVTYNYPHSPKNIPIQQYDNIITPITPPHNKAVSTRFQRQSVGIMVSINHTLVYISTEEPRLE